MTVSQIERDICRSVVQRFLNEGKQTPRTQLLKEFDDSLEEPLQTLVSHSVLTVAGTVENYSPKAVAFGLSGDPAALAFARQSTEIVFQILLVLFKRRLDSDSATQTQFTPHDVEEEARNLSITLDKKGIRVGLALAQEFGVMLTFRRDEEQVWVASFAPSERIYSVARNKKAWDEHIKQHRIALERKWEEQSIEPDSADAPVEETESPIEVPMTISPKAFLAQAIKAVPAVRYALGIGGLISVVAIVGGFKIDFRVALFGTVVMLVLMVVLLVFAKAASRPQATFRGPTFILTWFSLVLFMATATALFLSVFFGKPLDLRTLLVPVHAEQASVDKPDGPGDTLTQYEPFGELRPDEYDDNDGSRESEDKAKNKVEQRLSHYTDQALVKEADALCQNLYTLANHWNQEQKDAGSDFGKATTSDLKNIMAYSHRTWPEVEAVRTALVPKIPPNKVEQINVLYSSGASLVDKTGLGNAKDVDSVRQYLKALRDAFVASRGK